MLRLVTLNLNGIRSAAKKGLEAWVDAAQVDCMAVQEIKAQAPDMAGQFETLAGLRGYFHFAQKKGYSGVGLYCRHEPSEVVVGLGWPEFDPEGRWVEARFDTPQRKLSLISGYFPSGSSSEDRQQAKCRFLALMRPHLLRLKLERGFVLMADVNIAHHPIDLKNWKGNLKNSGFTPEERAWMSDLLDEESGVGLVDVFRKLNSRPEQYTWWSQRGQARAKNVGWRIDYHLATPALAQCAQTERIETEPFFSDHAPLIIDYNFDM